jgi:hypothetical protein
MLQTQVEVDGQGRPAIRAGPSIATSAISAVVGVSVDGAKAPVGQPTESFSKPLKRFGEFVLSATTTATLDEGFPVVTSVGLELGFSLSRFWKPEGKAAPVEKKLSPSGDVSGEVGCYGPGCAAH